MSDLDHGVEYVYADGTTVRDHGGQSWHPRPVRALVRDVGEWRPVQVAAEGQK